MAEEMIVKMALDDYLENPFWRKVYEGAPTEVSRRWWEMEFAHSWIFYFLEEEPDEEYYGRQGEPESEMGLEDWEYLYRYSGANPFKTKCKDMMEKLKKDSGGENG